MIIILKVRNKVIYFNTYTNFVTMDQFLLEQTNIQIDRQTLNSRTATQLAKVSP